jgi:hypothetical protein
MDLETNRNHTYRIHQDHWSASHLPDQAQAKLPEVALVERQ